jgi:hypothetical protein
MTPYIAIGCKRVVRDQGYLQSLNRPNVRLTFDHIARVEPDGVITVTGIRPFLILGLSITSLIVDHHRRKGPPRYLNIWDRLHNRMYKFWLD